MNTHLGLDLVRSFGTALLIGALVGIDREKRKEEGEAGAGGIRTFMLIGLAGATSAYLGRIFDAPWVFIATVVVGGGAALAPAIRETPTRPVTAGLTTGFAALVVLLLGGLCVLGHADLAVALGIVTSAVLAFKQPIHEWVRKVGTEDLYAGLKLLIATFIVLPLLPQKTIDPWGALNPYTLWLLVILISGLSLVGYVATRWLGSERGIVLTGVTGGLVSSTAVTLALARQGRDLRTDPATAGPLSTAVFIAWLIMVGRMGVLLAVTNPALARHAALPLTVFGLATAGAAVWTFLSSRRAGLAGAQKAGEVPLKNPFRLTSAIKFAALFAVVLLLVKGAQHYFPGGGIYVVATLAGMTDVDAITLSMADFARHGGDPTQAVRAALLAAATNTAVKAGLVAVVAGGVMWRQILLGSAVILAAAAAAWFLC